MLLRPKALAALLAAARLLLRVELLAVALLAALRLRAVLPVVLLRLRNVGLIRECEKAAVPTAAFYFRLGPFQLVAPGASASTRGGSIMRELGLYLAALLVGTVLDAETTASYHSLISI